MNLTPTQVRMLAVLSDGLPHSKLELWQCLDDDLAALTAIRFHLCRMRKVLRPKGEDVLPVFKNRRVFYQHVLLKSNPYNGKR